MADVMGNELFPPGCRMIWWMLYRAVREDAVGCIDFYLTVLQLTLYFYKILWSAYSIVCLFILFFTETEYINLKLLDNSIPRTNKDDFSLFQSEP